METNDENSWNDCGGFGFDYCSDYSEWVEEEGYVCELYMDKDEPGCPYDGNESSIDGITANEACCYCGGGKCSTCFTTINKGCTNDDEWSAVIGNETISCDWFEDNDEPGCAETYLQFIRMNNVTDPRKSCCHCSEYGCQDLKEWRDGRRNDYGKGYGCWWYEKWDQHGCPQYGDKWPDIENGITAREACCHCSGYDDTFALPVCYDYNNWVDKNGKGCYAYEDDDDPSCPESGDKYPNQFGVNANDACCYCNGGSFEVPTATPSHQHQPTTSPSVIPSNWPTYKYEPSATPSISPTDASNRQHEPSAMPSIKCYDYIGWIDGYEKERGCEWYEDKDERGCTNYGDTWPSNDGITAHEACCYCGGIGLSDIGFEDFYPRCNDNDVTWQNIVQDKFIPGEQQTCNMLDYYFNISTRSFLAYTDLLNEYCNDLHNGTMGMSDACCICNEITGTNLSIDTHSNISDVSNCNDLQVPKPWKEHNCEWFAEDATRRCEEYGGSTILLEGNNEEMKNANEVCCVCGGGTQGCYEFNENWIDSHPHEPFNCNDYSSYGRCAVDGSGLISEGHNANTQCCVCGGGYTFENNNIITNATDKMCLNEKDWQHNTQNFSLSCSDFVDERKGINVEQCLAFGHLSSNLGVNASDGCCDCWYGYDAITGGGYRGVLLGKMFRIGTMNYTDLEYVHNVSTTGDVDESSTIFSFVKTASEAYGFGLIQYELNELLRMTDEDVDYHYKRCLDGKIDSSFVV